MKISICWIGMIITLIFPLFSKSQTIVEKGTTKLLDFGKNGKLVYTLDEKGNRLPDFSYVGYHSGEKAIPDVPVKIKLEPLEGDNTQMIQDALDKLSIIQPDKNGHRGAVLLKRGIYRINGSLFINQSGIVLRGEGSGSDGTVLIATGYDDFKYKRTLIQVGDNDDIILDSSSFHRIIDDYVPVGVHTFTIKSTLEYKTGDRIVVYRPSTKNWISSIGCDSLKSRWAGIRDVQWIGDDKKSAGKQFPSWSSGVSAEVSRDNKKPGFYYQRLGYDQQYCILQQQDESWEDFKKRIPISEDGKSFDFTRQWEAGEYDLFFERRITNIEGNQITIDAPIVHSMDTRFGGGGIFHYEISRRISEVGIENLRLISEFAKPAPGHPYGTPEQLTKAELHAWNGIVLNENTENTWVRGVTGNYFGWSFVSAKGKNTTIQDCVNLGHASEIAGGRRYPFMINGQLNLVQRCVAFEGRHEFVNQAKTLGPNVFVDCIGYNSKNNAGPHHRYAVGNLYDNVTSEKPMESRFRGNSGTGHGWAGTQTCFYNCVAPEFLVEPPTGGMSWVIGCGKNPDEANRVKPASLYYQQVQDRLGKEQLKHLVTQEQLNSLGEYGWVKNRLINDKK